MFSINYSGTNCAITQINHFTEFMRQTFARLTTLLMLLFISSCNLFDGRQGDQKVARVNNKLLYTSDLIGLVPKGTNANDSISLIKRYIENWTRQQIFLTEAEKHVGERMHELNRKIDDYRNSLIIFSFESDYIANKLDTVITDHVLNEYYLKHQDEFKLRDNVVQVNFVKLPSEVTDNYIVRRLIRSDQSEDIEKLEDYCINNAALYFLDQDSWFIFADILREVPINPSNHESFLKNNKYVELSDQYYRYFLFIRDYRLEGTVSPLAFQSEKIKSIILNHRKQNLINNLRLELYLNAVKNSAVELF